MATVRVQLGARVVTATEWRQVGAAHLGRGSWTLQVRLGAVAKVSTAELEVRTRDGMVIAQLATREAPQVHEVRFGIPAATDFELWLRNSAAVGAAFIASAAFTATPEIQPASAQAEARRLRRQRIGPAEI